MFKGQGGGRRLSRDEQGEVEVKAAVLTSYWVNLPSKYHHIYNLSPSCLQLERLSRLQTLDGRLCQINQRSCRLNIIIICKPLVFASVINHLHRSAETPLISVPLITCLPCLSILPFLSNCVR